MPERFDIIGDVHGMVRTLGALVKELGYRVAGERVAHPDGRRLISVGDLLDRGPDPLGCAEFFQKVVSSGAGEVILGNHELNALHHQTGLREDTERTRGQLRTTLRQIAESRSRWESCAAFLRRRPLVLKLDRGQLRVIHACWEDSQVARLPEDLATHQALVRTAPGGDLSDAVECCLKGPEEASSPWLDADGTWRQRRRVPWWSTYPAGHPLVVFGHYWFPWVGGPEPVARPAFLGPGQNAACVDFSAGLGGPLVALRYPEREFVQVDCLDELPD